MPLNPFRNDSTRPSDGAFWRRLRDCGQMTKRPNQRCVGWVERSDTHQSTVWVSRGSTHPTNVRRTCRSGLARDDFASAFPFCFCLSFCPQITQTTRSPNPVRRPSVGAVERGVWHGCQTRHVGPWMARLADPRSSTGAREVERSETRMPGVLSLWLLSLCARKEKVTRRKAETSSSSQRRCCGR